MTQTPRVSDKLVPLFRQDLDLLAWFAAWTPEVHRANWTSRRAWPPGFREMADTGDPKASTRVRDKLLPYGLVEGSITCARLTPRGRAALKLYGRDCPTHFTSHCADVFDDVGLMVRFDIDYKVEHLDALKSRYKRGDIMDDTPETWRAVMVEYNEETYGGHGTHRAATVHLTRSHSTGHTLNGSLREHHQFVSIAVTNNAGQEICEFYLSTEQLADMLTANCSVPCTVNNYFGRDGMRYSEPCAPQVSAYERMQARLEKRTDDQAARIDEIIAEVEGLTLGKKAKESLLHSLRIAKDLGIKNHAYTAEQTLEEVSKVVEGAATILRERVEAGTLALDGQSFRGLLGGPSTIPMLIEADTIDPDNDPGPIIGSGGTD